MIKGVLFKSLVLASSSVRPMLIVLLFTTSIHHLFPRIPLSPPILGASQWTFFYCIKMFCDYILLLLSLYNLKFTPRGPFQHLFNSVASFKMWFSSPPLSEWREYLVISHCASRKYSASICFYNFIFYKIIYNVIWVHIMWCEYILI